MRRFRNISAPCEGRGATASPRERLRRLAGAIGSAPPVDCLNVQHVKGCAAEVPARSAQAHGIDARATGMAGRLGGACFLIARAAEKLPGRVACSVPAIKPAGFVPPVAAPAVASPASG